jgi:YbbR domain-containing protein
MVRQFLIKYSFVPVAVVLAGVLWLHIITEREFEKIITVPLEIVNVPENLRIANRIPDTAMVSVAGRGKDLIWLKFSDAVVYVEAQDAKYGEQQYSMDVNLENIALFNFYNVKVKHIKTPRKINVIFDSKYKKIVKVKPEIIVNLAQDYAKVGDISLKPDSVKILGPRSVVSGISHISTKKVVIENAKNDSSFYVFLRKPNLGSIMLGPNKIKVEYKIEKIEKYVLRNIPVRLINAPRRSRYKLNKKTVSILIAGAQSLVKKIRDNPALISVTVDYNRFAEEDKSSLEPKISIFENVEWDFIPPSSFKLVKDKK